MQVDFEGQILKKKTVRENNSNHKKFKKKKKKGQPEKYNFKKSFEKKCQIFKQNHKLSPFIKQKMPHKKIKSKTDNQ